MFVHCLFVYRVFFLYAKIRVLSREFELWSEARTQRVDIEETRPAKVGDEEFNITSFTYRSEFKDQGSEAKVQNTLYKILRTKYLYRGSEVVVFTVGGEF